MELMTGGTLYDLLHKEKPEGHQSLSYTQKLQVSRSIARGIQFLHSRSTMHRDLKSKNILVIIQSLLSLLLMYSFVAW
jgi:serine/threonine protein kinase